MTMKLTTNVIYLTSRCNLNCEYCYEKENRPNNTITYDEIDSYLEYLEKHSKQYSHIVLFGGEPFLCLDEIDYILEKLINEYDHKKYSVSLNTNGLLLLDNKVFERYLNMLSKIPIRLKISYDGPNSFRRIDYNRECVNNKIEEVIKKLDQNNIEYGISYTWQKDNDKTIIYDLIYIIEKYNPEKIALSINFKELDLIHDSYQKRLNEIKPYLYAIYKEYKIPLCEMTCEICKKCQFTEANIYAVPKSKDIKISPKYSKKEFNFW